MIFYHKCCFFRICYKHCIFTFDMAVAYTNFKKEKATINDSYESVTNEQINNFCYSDPVLDIHVSCQNLVKMDIGSESDPMVVLFIPVNGQYVEVARTEVIWNNKSPSFVKFFQTLYIFEMNQPLRFSVYDCDSEKAPLSKHDFIGYVDTDVQHLATNMDQEIKFPIKHDSKSGNRGQLILTVQQTTASSSVLTGQMKVFDLKKMKTFSKNSPFIQISKPSESGRDIPVYRSEVVQKCQGCTFKPFTLPLQTLCGGDIDIPVAISVYDHRANKAPVLIGSCSGSPRHFMESIGTKMQLENNKRKTVGFFSFKNLNVTQVPTFIDYLRSGLQLNMITAIDFTASNGNPTTPNSLHFITPTGLNQYQNCISSVGSILTKYDHDQQFPVFGFGAKINGLISHCFPLTFDPANPNVQGLQGILRIYQDSLMKVQLSGPTLFTPIIRAATQVAIESYNTSRTYTILLVLTDGVINDMNETIDAIVDASDAPLSIIIIGVGNADFSAMEFLDADDSPLVSKGGIKMKRDIVQFVPFNKFLRNNGLGLESEVLAEVPKQVHDFCSTHGFIPQMTPI